ncbi:MAG: ArsA family ATPase [Lachnospiraceae bacterium]|nr:ArsA family ATPase [Lachnospiraceae bacterium]
MSRIYIITGKGGVGKTSVASAHAVRSAQEGKNTLLVSADMAHNLGDIFQVRAGGKVVEIAPCLSLLELDPYMLMREEYPHINKAIADLSGKAGFAMDQVGETYMIPGMENLFSLLKIRDLYLSGKYDRIIVDCAPTGETLSLLKLPELLSWYVEKFSPVGRTMTRVLTPVAKLRYRMQLPDEAAMDEFGQLYGKLVMLQDLLKNPETSRVRLVCIPEKMVVEETRRSYMYLNLYHYPVDTVFINRILPEDTGSSFMKGWQQIQKGYLAELESVFTDLTITRIPWYPSEIRGMEAVRRLSEEVLGDRDLFDRPVRDDNEVYSPIEGGYSLTIRVPGASQEEVEVFPRAMDVDIRIRNQLRSIPLPGVLRGARMTSATVNEGCLTICFALPERE